MRSTKFLYKPFFATRCLRGYPKTYLFYDWETTGLNPAFAQGVRFAAIRTTPDFKVVEKHTINVRLRSDVIIEPGAAIVNRLRPAQLDSGQSEYEAAKHIHGLVNKPGTTSLGFNSLAFDESFLQGLFYRTFLNPYSHHRKNDCKRMDVYPMTVAAFYLHPELLKWSFKKDKEKVSFRLEDINTANGLFQGQMHDAMTDTTVTLELAKILSTDRELWKQFESCSDAKTDKTSIEACKSTIKINNKEYKIAYLINHRSVDHALTPVLLLGESCRYSNQTVFLKPDSLTSESAPLDTILTKAKIIRKKYGQAPFVMPMIAKQIEEFKNTFSKQIEWLSNNPTMLPAIQNHFLNKRYDNVQCDAYAQLYQLPFPTPADEALFSKFHNYPSDEKLAVVEQFTNPVYRELGLRIVGNHFFETLTSEAHEQFDRYLQTVFTENQEKARIDYKGERAVTMVDTLEEVKKNRAKSMDVEQNQILNDCEQWSLRKKAEFMAPVRQSPSDLLSAGLFGQHRAHTASDKNNQLSSEMRLR